MKRFLSVSVAILLPLLAGCFNDLAIPESVAIKTNATYNFTLMEKAEDLSNYFSLDTLTSSMADSDSRITIYEYNPGEAATTKQFLMDVEIEDISLNFKDEFNKIRFNQEIEEMNFSENITVPTVSMDSSQTIDISNIKKAAIAATTVNGKTSDDSITFTAFSTMSFSSGYLVVKAATTGKVSLSQGGSEVTSGVFSDCVAKLPLTGKTLYTQMSISFENAVSDTSYIAACADNSEITKATGLSIAKTTIPVSSKDFSVPSSGFKTCTVGEGTLTVAADTPESWENVTLEYEMKLSAKKSNWTDNCSKSEQKINLTDKTLIAGEKLTVEFDSCSLAFSGATVDFTEGPTVKTSCEIKKFSEIRAAFDIKTEVRINEELKGDKTKIITAVGTYSSGFTGTYTNGLPSGNDIDITTTSAFLGISSGEKFIAGKTDEPLIVLSEQSTHVTNIKNNPAIDFSIIFGLQKDDSFENENVYVFKNAVPGETYEISLSLTPQINIDYVTINAEGLGDNGVAGTMPTDLNFSSYLSPFSDKMGISDMGSKLKLSRLPVYLYCALPDTTAFDNAAFVGTISARLQDSNGDSLSGYEPKYLLGSDGETAQLKAASVPTFTKNSKGEVITNLAEIPASISSDIASVVNGTLVESAAKLCLDYEMSLAGASKDGVTIKYAELEKMENTSIAIRAVVVLPLEFSVTSEINMDLLSMFEKTFSGDKDLFDRPEPTDTSDYDKYLDAIEYAALIYKSTQLPFSTENSMDIIVDMDGNGTSFSEQKLSLSGGTFSLNPAALLKEWPLQPTVNAIIPKGSFSVNRELAIAANIAVQLKTDGTIDLFSFD